MENEELTIEGLKESLGLSASEPESTAADTNAETTQETETTETETEESSTESSTAEDNKTQETKSDNEHATTKELPLQQVDKQAHTFAEMRKTISEQNKLLAELGKALGIQGKPDEVIAGLKKAANVQNAKEAGIPPEILERLNNLEAEKQEREANDRKIQVYAAINNFQRNQGLSKQELDNFLVQLARAGKNPFEQDIDLRAEYLVMNFDALQQKAIQAALEKQANLDKHADEHGSTPNKQVGAGGTRTTEVKTLDDLDAFLKQNVK